MILTEPQLFGYVFWSQDRERNVWMQVVKDRKNNVIGSLGTWREAAEGEPGLEITFKVSDECPCEKGSVTIKLVRTD